MRENLKHNFLICYVITQLIYPTQNTTLGSRVLKNREIKDDIIRFKIQNSMKYRTRTPNELG